MLRLSFSRKLFVSGVSFPILNRPTETMAGALVPKPNVTSPVWEHFGFQPNEKGEPANLDEPICKICCKKVPVTRGNTSNLRCHLANCHPAIEAQLPPQASGRGATSKRTAEASNVTSRQLGVAEAFAKSVKYSRESNRHKCLTAAVTLYLVQEMVPFNTVEKPAFKSMLQKFDKQYELPGKTYFFRNSCAENVQHGKVSYQKRAHECRLLFCHNGYVVKCQYDSLYESNGSLSQHGMDSEITLPRNRVYARKPHVRQYFGCSPARI